MEFTEESMSVSNIKNLRESISYLHETEHIEIFKLIKQDTDKYSENKNGIFINLSKLNYSTLKKIQDFVNFCIDNKRLLEVQKKEIDSLREYIDKNKEEEKNYNSESESITEDDETESDSCNENENDTYIPNISAFEKEIIYSNNNDKNTGDNNYSGIRAKIMKKCNI